METVLNIVSLGKQIKKEAKILFESTVWGADYITELFMSSASFGKRALKRMQESYLRHPEKRTWIKAALYATAFLAAWTSTCILLGASCGILLPVKWLVMQALAAETLVMKVSCLALALLQLAVGFIAFCSLLVSECSRERRPREETFLPILPAMGTSFTVIILLLGTSPFNKIAPLRHDR